MRKLSKLNHKLIESAFRFVVGSRGPVPMPSGSSSARQLSAHHSFKDRPDRRGIWTIDGRPSLRESQRFTFKPKVRTYVPPAALPPPKKTLTTLEGDPSAEEALLAEIDGWNAEAERLESSITNETLSEKLARLMFTVDVPMQIKAHEKAWDPKGDGSITVGEASAQNRSLLSIGCRLTGGPPSILAGV